MEPPKEVRCWINHLVGVEASMDRLSEPLGGWAILSSALSAVHEATISSDTEPATFFALTELAACQSMTSVENPK